MKSNDPICIIGGFDKIAWSYFQSLLNDEKKAIFINVNDKKIRKNFVFNVNVMEIQNIENQIIDK